MKYLIEQFYRLVTVGTLLIIWYREFVPTACAVDWIFARHAEGGPLSQANPPAEAAN